MSQPAPPFDPLDWLSAHGVRVLVDRAGDGVRLAELGQLAPRKRRMAVRIGEVYGRLLRIQIEGERPRSVRKLLALGVIRLDGGRYATGKTSRVKNSSES